MVSLSRRSLGEGGWIETLGTNLRSRPRLPTARENLWAEVGQQRAEFRPQWPDAFFEEDTLFHMFVRRLAELLAIAIFVAPHLSLSADPAPESRFKLADVIPAGKTTVELVEMRFSERAEELARKWTSAVATNQDWWMDYVKKYAGGGPLPYHTNLGISEKEYKEYLEESDKSRHLNKTTDAYLIFKRHGEVLSLDIADTNSPVEALRLNLSTGDLFAAVGRVGKPAWCSSGDTTQPIGAYEGYSWRYEKGDVEKGNFRIVSLWIYRLKPSGKIFWRIQDGETRKNRNVHSVDLRFQYRPKLTK